MTRPSVVIVGGGPETELPPLARWSGAQFVGVDKGAVTLLSWGLPLAAAVGDFDSVTAEEYGKLRRLFPSLEKAPSEKDQTDTELALLKAMEYLPEEVIVTGVTGGRQDHAISALHAVYACQMRFPSVRFSIMDKQNRICFLKPGQHRVEHNPAYSYLSFYPFDGEVEGFSLKGFKYDVTDETLRFGSTRFTSNELDGTGTVAFRSGACLMVESADR